MATSTEVARNAGRPKAEYEVAPASFADALAQIGANVSETDAHVIVDAWQKLNQDKDPLVGRPFTIQHVAFMEDPKTHNPYVNLWVVRDDDALFRVTDGSTGIFQQVTKLVEDRLAAGHAYPYDYYIIDNGLTRSDFMIDKNGKAVPDDDPTGVSKAATYYLA